MASEKNSLTEQAYQTLKEKILRFDLQPGMVVSDYLISQELEMSRTPIRQALVRLEQDGLLEHGAHSNKMVVSRLDITDIREINEARSAIESKAGHLIVDHGGLTEEQKQRLQTIHQTFQDAVASHDIKQNFHIDGEFHHAMMEYAGNSRLIQFFERLQTQSMRARYLTVMNTEWFQVTLEDHQRILNALFSGDKDELSASVLKHMENSTWNYERILRSMPNYAVMNSVCMVSDS